MTKLILKLGVTALLAGLLLTSFMLNAAEEARTAKLVSLINPTQTYGVRIGDKLSRKLVLDVPAPFKISDSAFPKKGSKNNEIELVEVGVITDQQKENTRYTINLTYQIFTSSSNPTVMQLPVEKLSLTGGAKSEALQIPAWSFWFSPIVTGGIDAAQKKHSSRSHPPIGGC